MTYSQVVYAVSVEVADAGNGTLEATFDGKYAVKDTRCLAGSNRRARQFTVPRCRPSP
ncbi:MAG: hypothetical protein ACLVKA_04300 [Collinsella aerofaciens]